MDIDNYLQQSRKIIDSALFKYLPLPRGPAAKMIEAMRYSVLTGGKRIRAVLMLAIADMLGAPHKKVLPAACAVEYVHTSTLILDDLPCMDDSDTRRGGPSVHKKFGQSTAILASYSLMALAFGLLAESRQAAKYLTQAIGALGVCAGQYVDLESGAKKIDKKMFTYLHKHKTADLFVASCLTAGSLCGARAARLDALRDYGRYLGLAFQACDDMLSLNKTDMELGKQTKKDKDSPNIVHLFGEKKAQDIVGVYVKKAEEQLDIFQKNAALKAILRYIAEREK